MPACELCGKTADVVAANIEGVELKVCPNCTAHGIVKQRVPSSPKLSAPRPAGPEYRVISNFAALLHSAREKKGMNQEDFAKFIRERESILAKWEAGTVAPGIDAAKRIGKQLGLSLIELEEVSAVPSRSAQKSDEPTLGDFVKVRQRK